MLDDKGPGYPEGVPDNDFIPLVAILKRRLNEAPSEADIERVTAHLLKKGWPVELDAYPEGKVTAGLRAGHKP